MKELKTAPLLDEIKESVVDTLIETMGDYWESVETAPQPQKTTVDYYNDGVKNLNDRKNEEAISNFTKAIELDLKYVEAYNKRGMLYANSGQYEKAILDYSEIIKMNPKTTTAYHNRGMCFYALNQYKDALPDLKKAADLNPNDESIAEVLKIIEDRIKPLAVDPSDESITPQPKSSLNLKQKLFRGVIIILLCLGSHHYYNYKKIQSYNEQGLIYFQNKDYDNAVKEFNNAIKMDEKYAEAYFNRGEAYLKKIIWKMLCRILIEP